MGWLIILGVSALTFVVGFALGRWHRLFSEDEPRRHGDGPEEFDFFDQLD